MMLPLSCYDLEATFKALTKPQRRALRLAKKNTDEAYYGDWYVRTEVRQTTINSLHRLGLVAFSLQPHVGPSGAVSVRIHWFLTRAGGNIAKELLFEREQQKAPRLVSGY